MENLDNKTKEQLIEEIERLNSKIAEYEIQERYYLALNAAKDGIYDWDLVTNEIYYSPNWKRMLGYEDNELPNDFSIWETLTEPEDVQRSWEMQNELIERKRDQFEMEFRMKHKDGHWVYILSRAEAIFDKDGKAIRIVGTHTDITEKIENIKRLDEEKKKTQQYLDIAEVILVSLDSDGTVQLINPKGCEVLGYTKEEIIGKSWYDNFLPERMREQIKVVAKKVFTGEIESVKYYENEILTKLGEEKIIAWNNAVLKDGEGNIIGTLSSGEDITLRKKNETELLENERKLSSLLSNIDAGVVVHAADTSIIEHNERASTLLGLSHDQLMGKKAFDKEWKFIDENNSPIPIEEYPVNKIIATNKAYKNIFIGVIRPINNDTVWLLVNGAPVHDSNGNLIEVIISFIEVTELRRTERALIESEGKFKTLVENNEGIIYMLGINGEFILSEGKGLAKLGIKPGEVVGKSVYDLYKDYPEMLESMEKAYKGETVTYEMKMGDIYFHNLYTPHINPKGEIEGLLGLSIDITESKNNELELETYRNQLEELVNKRTSELNEKNSELDNALKVFVGQEQRIINLQNEIIKLKEN